MGKREEEEEQRRGGRKNREMEVGLSLKNYEYEVKMSNMFRW